MINHNYFHKTLKTSQLKSTVLTSDGLWAPSCGKSG